MLQMDAEGTLGRNEFISVLLCFPDLQWVPPGVQPLLGHWRIYA